MALFSDVDKKAAVKAAMTAAGGIAGTYLKDIVDKEAQKNSTGTWQKWVLDNGGLAQAALGFGIYSFGRKQKGIRTLSESLGMGMMVAGTFDYLQQHVTFSGPSLGAYVPNAYMEPIRPQQALSGGNLGAYENSYRGVPSASSSRGRIV
jgi:hypothetical protein